MAAVLFLTHSAKCQCWTLSGLEVLPLLIVEMNDGPVLHMLMPVRRRPDTAHGCSFYF